MCPFQLQNSIVPEPLTSEFPKTAFQTNFSNCGLQFISFENTFYVREDENFHTNKHRLMPYTNRDCNEFVRNLANLGRIPKEEFFKTTLPDKKTAYFYSAGSFLYNVECSKIRKAT
jgi:hypothetical protein